MCARLVCLAVVAIPALAAPAEPRDAYASLRHRMVDQYIAAEGITNERVLDAMRNTPRHEFVLPGEIRRAYDDTALPIGNAQTISPPFIVAYMTATIDPQPSDKVLEIGTGSGYQAAVLSPLVKDVYSIEIVDELARSATKRLERLNYDNVHVKSGDGYLGWPEHAPFDKIIVTCSPEKVPAPLIQQLAEGGKLLIPLGERYQQVFYLFEKHDAKLSASKLVSTLFVPMTGESEAHRDVQPDPLHPQIVNGGFELDQNGDGRPDGWHYLRQATLVEGAASSGQRSLSIESAETGRLAQGLQGFAVDGRKIAALNIHAAFRPTDLASGPNRNEHPGLVVLFFDRNRKMIGSGLVRPPIDGDGWQPTTRLVPIPVATREAIIALTLAGGTGKLEIDDVSIIGAPR
jgi:protein-L-isoaspartate(D-aspartate) O-methyltransferase